MTDNPFQTKLTQFADDEVLFEAVRGILLSRCDLNLLQSSEELPNDLLGAEMRAHLAARSIIASAFDELRNYKTVHKDAETVSNPNNA